MIKDGDGENSSTNGTWLFAEEELAVEQNTLVKAGLSIFKVNMISWVAF